MEEHFEDAHFFNDVRPTIPPPPNKSVVKQGKSNCKLFFEAEMLQVGSDSLKASGGRFTWERQAPTASSLFCKEPQAFYKC